MMICERCKGKADIVYKWIPFCNKCLVRAGVK